MDRGHFNFNSIRCFTRTLIFPNGALPERMINPFRSLFRLWKQLSPRQSLTDWSQGTAQALSGWFHMSCHQFFLSFFMNWPSLVIQRPLGWGMQADAPEFSHLSPTVSDEVLGMWEHFCTDRAHSCYTTCSTADQAEIENFQMARFLIQSLITRGKA